MTIHPPTTVHIDQFTCIGITARTNNTREMQHDTAQIPGLWQTLYTQNLLDQIPLTDNTRTPIAVYTEYESDHTGDYTLLVGAGVTDNRIVPAALSSVTVQTGRYLVFTATGDFPQAVIAAWEAVWQYFAQSTEHKRSYTTDFEHYIDAHTVSVHIAID